MKILNLHYKQIICFLKSIIKKNFRKPYYNLNIIIKIYILSFYNL